MSSHIPSAHDKFKSRLFNEDFCLEIVFQLVYGHLRTCPNPKCRKPFSYSRVSGEKKYQCAWPKCSSQLSPLSQTLMRDTKAPIGMWFRIVLEMVSATSGIAAESIRDQLKIKHDETPLKESREVKPRLDTIRDLMRRIRMGMEPLLPIKLRGTVHIDETFIGGHKKLVPGTDQKGIGDKVIVFGMRDNYGNTMLVVIPNKKAETFRPIIERYIEKGSIIHHDANASYGDLKAMGYLPKLVPSKSARLFGGVTGVNNNAIEGTWSRLKKFISGTHGQISEEHLQATCHEFSLHQGMTRLLCKQAPVLMVLSIIVGKILTADNPVVKGVYRKLREKLVIPSEEALIQDWEHRKEALAEKYRTRALEARELLAGHSGCAADAAESAPE